MQNLSRNKTTFQFHICSPVYIFTFTKVRLDSFPVLIMHEITFTTPTKLGIYWPVLNKFVNRTNTVSLFLSALTIFIQYILSWQCNMIWCTTGKRVRYILKDVNNTYVSIFLCHYLKPVSTHLMETAFLIYEYFFQNGNFFLFIIVNITISNTNLISDFTHRKEMFQIP